MKQCLRRCGWGSPAGSGLASERVDGTPAPARIAAASRVASGIGSGAADGRSESAVWEAGGGAAPPAAAVAGAGAADAVARRLCATAAWSPRDTAAMSMPLALAACASRSVFATSAAERPASRAVLANSAIVMSPRWKRSRTSSCRRARAAAASASRARSAVRRRASLCFISALSRMPVSHAASIARAVASLASRERVDPRTLRVYKPLFLVSFPCRLGSPMPFGEKVSQSGCPPKQGKECVQERS
eukprot:scaffold14082_cov99-Isochrysis_galbana.AAC.1